MGAPKGNRFWELRTKHGRDKLFETPEILWEEACKYFEWCEDNPLLSVDFKGPDLVKVEVPKMRAFTWEGLELFLGIESLRSYKTHENYKDFKHVIGKINQVMFKQKFEGAAAGFLNANIIARDLGLQDNQKIDMKANISGTQRTKIEFVKKGK